MLITIYHYIYYIYDTYAYIFKPLQISFRYLTKDKEVKDIFFYRYRDTIFLSIAAHARTEEFLISSKHID